MLETASPVIDVKALEMSSAVEKLTSGLLDFLSSDGRILAEKIVAPDESVEIQAGSPFYKKWWFWTIVSVAAVGLGTGGYFLLNSDDSVGVTIHRAGQ